jgi:tRNA (guanosine-2'-O-)-methyltransferase
VSAIVQQKYVREWTRDDYASLPRHSVRLVTWNASDPNLAGALRTAEAFRLEHVFMLRKPRTMAASVGVDRWQPHTYTHDLLAEVERAKVEGYTTVALEQTNASVPLTTAILPSRMCLVAGDEGGGVPPKALALCDMAVEIPQFGNVGSLNVVTATSIALYEWVRQHA